MSLRKTKLNNHQNNERKIWYNKIHSENRNELDINISDLRIDEIVINEMFKLESTANNKNLSNKELQDAKQKTFLFVLELFRSNISNTSSNDINQYSLFKINTLYDKEIARVNRFELDGRELLEKIVVMALSEESSNQVKVSIGSIIYVLKIFIHFIK